MEPIVGGQLPGRNEPCPCKSGKKFKRCHGDPVKRTLARCKAEKATAVIFREELDRLTS